MNDVSKDFGSSGAVQAPNPLAQPMADAILQECTELLEKTTEGRRLIDFSRQYAIKINVITGREPNFFTFEKDSTTLVCPVVTKAVDLDEMACNLGMGLRECECGYNGIALVTLNLPQEQKEWANYRKTLDTLTTMCRAVAPQQADAFTAVYAEIHAVQDVRLAVEGMQVGDAQVFGRRHQCALPM